MNSHAASGHAAATRASAADLRLLVRLVRGDATGIERCLDGREDALGRFADLCLQEGLSVVLLRAVAASPVRLVLDQERLDQLEQRRALQETRQQVLQHTLLTLSERFSRAGQSFILLKGPYLAARFYGCAFGREYIDLDLLVPRRDRERACELLVRSGLRQGSRTLLGATVTSHFVHGFDFTGGGANVDLHWRLSRHLSLRPDESRLWATRASYVLDGCAYDVLSDEHEVTFAALSLLRDLERERPKARNVLDLIQIAADLDAELDWEALLDRGAADGTRGPLVNVLGLCLDLADANDLTPRLSAALARRQDRRVRAPTAGHPMRFWPAPLGLGNKVWAARAYDGWLPASLLWWAVSLPFRVAVHRWR